ncbi:MAG: hypothetical protein JWQ25_320 [Daejeonella sp.]|nr:hypothetical protein [Daejeonella sp.]
MKIKLKFLKRFINWVGEQFEKLEPKLKKAVEAGVKVTEAIKNVVNNPALDFLTELTGTGIDNALLATIRGKIPQIFKTLNLVDDIASMSEKEVFDLALSKLAEKGDDGKKIFWHSFGIEVTKLASDGELSQGDIVYLSQWYYDHKVKHAEAILTT